MITENNYPENNEYLRCKSKICHNTRTVDSITQLQKLSCTWDHYQIVLASVKFMRAIFDVIW